MQKHLPRGNLEKKRCSEKFRKIHRKVAGLRPIKKETLTQVFSYEFCEIFKNTFFRAPEVASFVGEETGLFTWLVGENEKVKWL